MRSAVVEVTESARLYGETHVLWLTMPEEFRNATPGQFVMAYIGEQHDPLLGRACSFHRLREGRHGPEFALLFDIVGRGTDWLARREPGDAVRVVGPLGRGTSHASASTTCCSSAAGSAARRSSGSPTSWSSRAAK